MNCLHPKKKKIVDAMTGEVREIVYPCGHCINCLHAEQDMWSIRANETGKAYKQVIYDTLTLRPSAVRCVIDFTKPTKTGTLYGSTIKYSPERVKMIFKSWKNFHRYYPNISYESFDFIRKNNGKVYEFDEDELTNWIKRGRERYKRETGVRVDICFIITEEYGPKTSRPHFHLLMYGINLLDYQKYFGHPWNRDFGFTRPVWKHYTPWNKQDFECMSRYVCKYITKGDFESPLVKDGLQKKPFRRVSKGFGAGYLQSDKFKIFKAPELTNWKQYHMPSDQQMYWKVRTLCEEGKEEQAHKYYDEAIQRQDLCRSMVKDPDGLDLSFLTEQNIQDITIYYDSAGFAHKLPRYYIQKLFGGTNNEKTIYQSKVQALLEQSYCLYNNQNIQKVAASMGIIIPNEWLTKDCSTWELSKSTLDMVLYKYAVVQREQAEALAERRKTKLTNFYNRAKMFEGAPALQ